MRVDKQSFLNDKIKHLEKSQKKEEKCRKEPLYKKETLITIPSELLLSTKKMTRDRSISR